MLVIFHNLYIINLYINCSFTEKQLTLIMSIHIFCILFQTLNILNQLCNNVCWSKNKLFKNYYININIY